MSEKFYSRVSRIVAGSLNAIIDAAEGVSPEIIAKQSIREIEKVASDIKLELGKDVVKQKLIKERIDAYHAEHSKLLAQVKIALKEDREDLAEAGLAEQISIEEKIKTNQVQMDALQKEISTYQEYLDKLALKKKDMDSELKALSSKPSAIESLATKDKLDKAEEAFYRVMGDELRETDKTSKETSKLNELDELAKSNQVSERLAALKATLND